MKVTTEQLLGGAVILGVLLWHAHDARVAAEQPLDDLRRQMVELQVQQHDLIEANGILENNPDLSKFEAEIERQKYEARKQPAIVTAYNTVPGQTDASPCTPAMAGVNLCGAKKCYVAHNQLPLGTVIELERFGTCTVVDRLNARYNGTAKVDVSFDKDIPGARAFGVQHLTFVVH